MNNRLLVSAALVAASVAILAGCSSMYSSPPASTAPGSSAGASGGTLDTATSASLGRIVVNGAGMTVYVYDKDTRGATASACTGACVSSWPAVTTTSASPKVTGVTGTIGTITAVNGGRQITLNGLPLYTYSGDTAAGDARGQGVDGIWWVVSPAGDKISGSGGSGGY